MQLVLPEITAPAKLTFDPSQAMNDDAYYKFCAANPGLRIERSPPSAHLKERLIRGNVRGH